MKLDQLKNMMKAFGMKHLAEQAGVSRASLYNLIQGANFEGETLEKISKVLNVEFGVLGRTPTYDQVCDHLGFYGAPLAFNKSKLTSMSLEETTKWGIQFSQADGLLESVMPYFLFLNFLKMNRAQLLAHLDQEYQFQLLGYYLELACEYSENKKMKEFLNAFYRKDFPPFFFGFEKLSLRGLEVQNKKKNYPAEKWNVLSLNSAEDYFDRFRKWDRVV